MKKKSMLNEIEILKDATILTSTGEKIFFHAIQIHETGIFIGRINYAEEFVETGFIPKHNIINVLGGEKASALKKEP